MAKAKAKKSALKTIKRGVGPKPPTAKNKSTKRRPNPVSKIS